MSFKDLNIKPQYRSFEDQIVEEFYNPVLKESITYDRAVGFFTSTALLEITMGLSELIRNGGKIRLIVSPRLTFEDVEAIKEGYASRDKIVAERLIETIDILGATEEHKHKRHLSLISKLVALNILDIKVALIENDKGVGIFHEKLGIVKDKDHYVIAFSGSMNETAQAFFSNYESIDVFKSWTYENERVQYKVETFENIWNNNVKNVKTIDFPDVAREQLQSYQLDQEKVENDLVFLEFEPPKEVLDTEPEIKGPSLPDHIDLRDYQREAIEKWQLNEWRGIFDMATGTGKTITGLAAAAHLAEHLNHQLAIVIVCPYQHLVEQWVQDIEAFYMKPIIAHSASRQKKWKQRLTQKIEAFNLGVIDHFCLVVTNATFSKPEIQYQLKSIQKNLLLVVDEAHNFGAAHLSSTLLMNAQYRLGLSATIERHNDRDGTEALFNYFGSICLSYPLAKAIENGMLSPYYYYPVVVSLNEQELAEYMELTTKIAKAIRKDKNGKVIFSESAKMLMLKRARIVAGAENKIMMLEQQILRYRNSSHILVYCGATTIRDPGYQEGIDIPEEMKQIEIVTRMLGHRLKMKVAKFTSEESTEERQQIKESFATANPLQALVAIKCLDEGVNIPSIKTAFLLASSTNPKEYIQRRGRVLRKFEGKEFAEIFDFIVLPAPFEELSNYTDDEIRSMQGLVKRELERMKDFAQIAENASVADELIENIKINYLLNREEDYTNGEYGI